MNNKIIICLCTCSNTKDAQILSKKIIKSKLAACINIIPKITSIYLWKNKLENQSETLLIIKSKKAIKKKLNKFIKKKHKYDTPEIIFLKTKFTNKKYKKWLINNTL